MKNKDEETRDLKYILNIIIFSKKNIKTLS